MNNNSNALEIVGLTKIFSDYKALDDISFSISNNGFHGLIGENGSGKTTLIRTIIGLINTYIGEIKIFGINNSNPSSKLHVTYMPESTAFPNSMKLYDYLLNTSLLKVNDEKKVRSNIMSNLKKFNMWDLRKKNINNFSSGQKKKAMLIQAIISNSNLIILDEPTANLDPSTRLEVFQTLSELNKKGVAIFICSHNLAEISNYLNEATFISQGKLLWSGELKKGDSVEKKYFQFIKTKGGK